MSADPRELLERGAGTPSRAPDLARARREGARLRRQRHAARASAALVAVLAVVAATALVPDEQTVELGTADDPEDAHPLFAPLDDDDRAAALAADDPIGLVRDRGRALELPLADKAADAEVTVTAVPGWATEHADAIEPDAVDPHVSARGLDPGDPAVGLVVDDGHGATTSLCCQPVPPPGSAGAPVAAEVSGATETASLVVVVLGPGLETATVEGEPVPVGHGVAVAVDPPDDAELVVEGPAGTEVVDLGVALWRDDPDR